MIDLAKIDRAPKEGKSHFVKIGTREIETRGLKQGFWTDLYHRSMTVYWQVFFGIAAVIFVMLNAMFAGFYYLGDQPVAKLAQKPLSCSISRSRPWRRSAMATCIRRPTTGHLIATMEIFTGMCFLAVMTGLVFARFSRPRARFVFAKQPVVGDHQGRPTLMVRLANARHNTISQANARIWLIRAEHTQEGDQLRRCYKLKLDRPEHPMFLLSWMIFHVIDKASPLYGLTSADLATAKRAAGAQCRRPRRQFRAAALCPASLFVAGHQIGGTATGTSPAFRRRAVRAGLQQVP